MAANAQSNSCGEVTSQVFQSIGDKLYLKEDRADVHFVFNSNDGQHVRIPAHKWLLIGASDVFGAMFNGSWKENSEVEIVDASADAFKEFLQFFYLGKVKLTMDNVAEVMYLGKKYNVGECLKICSKFLKNVLDEKNICWGYKLAITYGMVSLKRFCEIIIGLKPKVVFASDGFLECDFEVLSRIVALERLACLEGELFEACMQRIEAVGKEDESAKEAAKIETRKLLKIFRFGSMSNDELNSLSSSYHHLFSYDEYREMFHLFVSNEFQPKILNGNREKRVEGKHPFNIHMIPIVCDRSVSKYDSSHNYHIKPVEKTTFSTNKSVLLWGFTCDAISWEGDQTNFWLSLRFSKSLISMTPAKKLHFIKEQHSFKTIDLQMSF